MRIKRRTPRVRAVTQSFKKVLNEAPASRAATEHTMGLVTGVDSIAAGQTSAVDPQVPTGAKIFRIEIQYAASNLVSIASFAHITVQLLRSGQGSINSNVVGGNPQRNQVIHQDLMSLGKDQNINRKYIISVPKQFQRVREGDQWRFNRNYSQITTDCVQVIYKFYR